MIGTLAVMLMVLAGVASGAGVVAVMNRRERLTEQPDEPAGQVSTQVADTDTCAWVGGSGSGSQILAEQLAAAGEASPTHEQERPLAQANGGSSIPRVLVGPRLDTGTEVVLKRATWPPWVENAEPGPAQIGNRWVVIERPNEGPDTGAIVVRAPGQTRLVIRGSSATASPGRRAVDTLGGFAGWALEWLPLLHGWLTGQRNEGPGDLDELEQAGWVVMTPDIAAEVLGMPLRLADADPRCWTSAAQPVPRANPGGDLHSLTLGDKRRDPLSLYVYRKDEHVESMLEGGEALLERWRQAGWDGREPVMRSEIRARGDARRLRARGDSEGEIEVDLSRLTHCVDPMKLARFWAYAVGRPGSKSGHFRLVVPSMTDRGTQRPARKCEVDERWRVVQAAAGDVPDESLAQCRERKRAARDAWHIRARQDVVRRLAEDVALDGFEDADAARDVARERVGCWLEDVSWQPAFGRARAATQDLVERNPGPPITHGVCEEPLDLHDEAELDSKPNWRSESMNATLSLINPTDDVSPALPEAAAPTWTRQPIDVVERWKARELEHHRFSQIVRPMNADERERARASLEVCGYDREWPIVLYEGQILDGRGRAELAFELWQQTGRADLIPSFVELVPDDSTLADEAALLYLQQRLIAARTLTEGERIAAAYRLFQLYRECRTKRPALGPATEDRYAQRSASARAAAAVAGVSPRNLERFAFVEKRGPEVLPPSEAKALLDAVESGELTPRAAERRVKTALAKREAESHARQLDLLAADLDDPVPEPPGVVFAAPGVKLARVDALTLLRSLPDGCVETVFFDGPYVLGKTGTTNKAGTRVPVSPGEWDAMWRSPDHYFEEFLLPVAAELERVLSPTGEVWASGTRHVIFAVERALSSMRSYRLYQDICWQKTSPPPRLHPQSGWTDDHELLLWYRSRDPKLARRDVTDAKALLGTAHATWPITRPSSNEYRFGRHPTQKPERLLEVILAAHNGLVLDFCAGACTTAVAAVRRRRPVLCGDLNDGDGYLGTGRLRVAAELGGSNDADPLRELAEWLTVECHLLEPVTEPRPNPLLDEFRWALLDPETVTEASPTVAFAHAIRRAIPDTRLLALALGIITAGPQEFASAWAEAFARLAHESGDEFRSAGAPHVLVEAHDYLAGFCSELGVVELDEALSDAWLAGEALAGVLRQE